jgi:uncharacterized RDD family membrane protein YckC
MHPDRWQHVSRVFFAALAYEESARTAFVREACAGDEALRLEVESLLARASESGVLSTGAAAIDGLMSSDSRTLLSPIIARPGGTADTVPRLEPGQQFGPYRIHRLLGRGGMGEVYEAEHLEHGHHVALKMLSQRLSDPADRARFLREGQLAASVSHPHIVYVYGSEEIAGMPAIAMELLRGGTLQDRITSAGPLPPVEAVDAILQVVSGLEAAHAAGILHRDIKPSNCFVDVDGTIKVGDFGLSIPALARDVTQLTITGTFRGTPQFAPPEHLRGEPLDVRSDIYAVGATLHCLLTGRPPFDDDSLMVLLSRIATEAPPSLRDGRPEIPRALAAVVLQCLAKNPADRPPSYRSLAGMLEPLGSGIRTPAPLGLRFAAGLMDGFFSQLLLTSPAVAVLAQPPPAFGARHAWEYLVGIVYFAITESVWGASPGKALCGFRVITHDGARPPFTAALLRALVFVVPPWFVSGLALLAAGSSYAQRPLGPWIVMVADTIVAAVLFATARRANGFAGMHELVSRTRTVSKPAGDVRRIVRPRLIPLALPANPQRIGPYVLLDALGARSNGGAALGYDERLRRTIWLRFPAADAAAVPPARRILRRPARPHWVAGQRAGGLGWDAYERVPGQPLDTLLIQKQSWETVRGWLCDLAEEVHAGARDGSLPVIDLNRVWIGDDGRARLLDWPVPTDRPDSAESSSAAPPADWLRAQRFLYQVAVSALEGHVVAETASHARAPRVPLPMPARDCLARLGEQRFGSSEEMLTAVRAAARGPAAVSRAKRAAHLALCAIPTLIMIVFALSSLYRLLVLPRADVATPGVAELAASLNRLDALDDRGVPSTDPDYRALELYIAGRHRDRIATPPIWSASPFAQRVMSTQQRTRATRIAASIPSPRTSDVDEAARILGPFLEDVRSKAGSGHPHIESVNAREVADRAGIRSNDVVVMLDGEPIWFASQLAAAIRRRADQPVTLSLLRDGQPLTIQVTPARRANGGAIGIVIANEEGPEVTAKVAWRYGWLHAIIGLMLAGTFGLLSALVSRGGIGLRTMGVAVVTRGGSLASGSTVRWRALLSWLPVLAASAAAFAGRAPLLTVTPQSAPFFAVASSLPPVFPSNLPPIFFVDEPSILFMRVTLIAVALGVFAAGALSAVITPERGLQDRLAGTWLVPR